MSPFVLSVLKYSLLALLYFFIYRAVKTVTVEVRGSRPAHQAAAQRPSPARKQKTERTRKPPTSVAVRGPEGDKLGTYKLGAPLEIGRSESCAIRLQDTYVSQVHAKLFSKDGAFFVEDLGSTNGTYLNDARVTAAEEIGPGDIIRVGKTTLELRR